MLYSRLLIIIVIIINGLFLVGCSEVTWDENKFYVMMEKCEDLTIQSCSTKGMDFKSSSLISFSECRQICSTKSPVKEYTFVEVIQ